MEFTEKELSLINKAEKRVKQATVARVLILLALIAGIVLVVQGKLDTKSFSYLAFITTCIAVFYSQLGSAPVYKTLA